MDLDKILEGLNLGEKERKVYQLIVEHGKISPTSLSKLTDINRTTIYSVANELKEKGLIFEDLGGKIMYYMPTPAPELGRITQKEKERIKEKEIIIQNLQEHLKNISSSKTYSIPKIRFIEGSDIEHYLHEATPRWHENMLVNDPTWWGFQDHTFAEQFEKWIDWSWKISPPEITLKLFTNDSEIEKKMKEKEYASKRRMKFWSLGNFSASQWIIGSYIVLVVTKQKPFYLVEINDSVLAHNMRELFKNLWEKI